MQTQPGERPNLLLIVAEDLSPRIGVYGDALATTPNLDRLAGQGVVFKNVFTAAPVCAPSRAALMTGRHQETIGAQHMRTRAPGGGDGGAGFAYEAVPPPEVKAFPELLRRAGYLTANAFKTDYQFGEPASVWDASSPNLTPWRSLPAREGRPIFAMVNLQITHESYLWPVERAGATAVEARIGERNARDLAPWPARTDPARVTVPAHLPDTPAVRRDIARHYDNIAAMDAQVGEILHALEADGLARETIVIWTTDHGDGLPHAKRRLSPQGLQVPLIVRFPDGKNAGMVREDVVSFVDLAPSLLQLAGAQTPTWMHGSPALKEPSGRLFAFAAADRMDEVPGRWRAATDGRWFYRRNLLPGTPLLAPLNFRDSQTTMAELWRLKAAGGLTPLQAAQFDPDAPVEALFDLSQDPESTRNLASDPVHAGELARLRRALDAHRERVGDGSDAPEREMAKAMWPGLVQPVAPPPRVELVPQAGDANSLRVRLFSPTPGASILYRIGEGPKRLYTSEFTVSRQEAGALRASVVRYGWRESEETGR